jgi:glucosamine--fructose-6-phosphate aminotransferase (isomerizing)
MDTGRYLLFDTNPSTDNFPLVMATSVSGRVTRTVEAMEMAKRIGALTVAITGHPDAPLAQASKRIIDCTIPSLPNPGKVSIPGVRSYRMTLIVHILFALYLAEVRGNLTTRESEHWRSLLRKTADDIDQSIRANEALVNEVVDELREEKYFVFVGDGPHRSTADFSAAKVIEAAGLIAYGQDTEEWAHIQYYEQVLPDVPTFVFCSGHRSHDRVMDLLPSMKGIGRKTIGILSEKCGETHKGFDRLLVMKGSTPEYFTPMVYPVLPELLSALMAEKLGVPSFRADKPYYQTAGNLRIRDTQPISESELTDLL